MDATKIVAGGSTGSLGGILAVYVGGRFGWHLTADDGAVITAAAAGVFAFIAHNGILGVGRILLRGDKTPPAASVTPLATVDPPPPAA